MVLKKHDMRADVFAASHQVLHSPELLDHVLSNLEKDALAQLARVCTLWYRECARHLWRTCTGLSPLQHNVHPKQQASIASLIHHLDCTDSDQLWRKHSLNSMPRFRNLETLIMHVKVFSHLWDEGYLAQILPANLKSLVISSDYIIDDSTGPFVHIAPILDGE